MVAGSLCVSVGAKAAEGAAPEWLPEDTLAVISLPSFTEAKAAFLNDPIVKMFEDPAMKPYVDGVKTAFHEQMLAGFEKELGFPISEYTELLNGQFTLALFADAGRAGPPEVNFFAALDAGDKGGQLKEKLADAKQRYLDEGMAPKRVTIRNQSFYQLSPGDGRGGNQQAPVGLPSSIYWGQVDSMLMIGTNEKILEKTLSDSGGISALAEDPAFRRIHASKFRDSYGYGWINFRQVMKLVVPQIEAMDRQMARNANPLIPKPSFVLDVLGLDALDGLAFNLADRDNGSMMELSMAIPKEKREGLFGLIALEEKDSSAPSWVPSDVVQFNRVRFNLATFWNNLEGMVKELVPPVGGIMELYLGGLGKDRDPNFNFRDSFFGNLGDDIITIGLPPRGDSIEELATAPKLMLFGSPDPSGLVESLLVLTGLIPSAGGAMEEREFLDRTIYSLTIPGLPMPGLGAAGGGMPNAGIHLVANEDYVIFSMDEQAVEDFLRGPKSSQKPLSRVGGLAQARSALGSDRLTSFRYDNARSVVEGVWEMGRKSPDVFAENLGAGAALGGPSLNDLGPLANFSALPPFERVAKYFHYSVGGTSADSQYLSIRWFRPTPPGLD